MEKERNKSGFIIGLLIGIIIILLVLVILFATDTISFKNKNGNTNEEKNPVTENNGSNNDNQSENVNKEHEYDRKSVEGILMLLGITESGNLSDACLNMAATSEEKIKTARDIVSFYSDAYGNLLKFPPDDVYGSIECGIGAADCYSISREKAQIFFEFYNLDGKITDYFQHSDNLEDEYIFWYNHNLGMCKYEITHDLDIKQTDSSLKIIDKQKVEEYEDDGYEHLRIKSTINRTVTYNLSKDNNGNFYLDKVEID